MKLKFLLPALLLPLFSLAQRGLRDNINLPEHNNKLVHFGINVGVNRSFYNFLRDNTFFQQDSLMVVESMNSTGLNLAWLVNLRMSEHLSLRTFPIWLTFTEKAFQYHVTYPSIPDKESPITTKKIQGISMALPVQLKFQSDRIENFRVYMIGGIRGEYDMAANAGKKNADKLFKIKKFDYGVEGGIGFHIYFPVFVLTPELKISYGLANVHDRDPAYKFSRVLREVNSRVITFSLTVE